MKSISVETLIEGLKLKLDCNQRSIASFTGLTESTISSNLGKTVEEVETKKAGRRIITLYVVTSSLAQKGASPASIKTALEKHVYADLDGNLDSVITSLHQDKYPLNVLINIAELGFRGLEPTPRREG